MSFRVTVQWRDEHGHPHVWVADMSAHSKDHAEHVASEHIRARHVNANVQRVKASKR